MQWSKNQSHVVGAISVESLGRFGDNSSTYMYIEYMYMSTCTYVTGCWQRRMCTGANA